MGCARLRPSFTTGTQTDSSRHFLEFERQQPHPVTAPTVCIKLFEGCNCVVDADAVDELVRALEALRTKLNQP
jgi:hypothetical protein